MGTLTADVPQLAEHCSHKLASSCRLTSTRNCCACADDRNHSPTYRKYIDGVGYVQAGVRWDHYCWPCYSFWNARVEASGVPPHQTRIPDNPNQDAFTKRWLDFHQGYRIVHTPDGREERIAVLGEPLKDVDPGFMPRTLEELRAGRLTGEEVILAVSNVLVQEETEVGPSLDEALDQLLDDALAEEVQEQPQTSRQAGQEAPAPTTVVFTPIAEAEASVPAPSLTVVQLQALRQEIEDGRRQIESKELILQDHQRELDADEEDLADTEERIEAYQQEMTLLGNRMARYDRYLDNERQHLETTETRISLRTAALRRTREQLQGLRHQLRQNRRRAAAEGNFARVFGTREDIQSDDYVSPITNMFMRVNEWGRRQHIQTSMQSTQAEAPLQTQEHIEEPLEENEYPLARGLLSAERLRGLNPERRALEVAAEQAVMFNPLPASTRQASQGVLARGPADRVYMTTRGPMRNGQPLPPSEARAYYRDPGESPIEEATRTLRLPPYLRFTRSGIPYNVDRSGPQTGRTPLELDDATTMAALQRSLPTTGPAAAAHGNQPRPPVAPFVEDEWDPIDDESDNDVSLGVHSARLAVTNTHVRRTRINRGPSTGGQTLSTTFDVPLSNDETGTGDAFRAHLERREQLYESLTRPSLLSSSIGQRGPHTIIDIIDSDEENEVDRAYRDHLERRLQAPFTTNRGGEDEADMVYTDRLARRLRLYDAPEVPPTLPLQVPSTLATVSLSVYNAGRRRSARARSANPIPAACGLDIADERPKAKSDEEMMVKLECKICMSQTADTACLPCGHLSMCSWCADQAIPVKDDRTRPVRKGLKCPVCRDTVKSRVKIFVA